VARINAAARMHGLSYSRFMHGLKLADVGLDRKVIAYLALNDQVAFAALVEKARGSEQ
jgi:large subunit ribosomal protein L20